MKDHNSLSEREIEVLKKRNDGLTFRRIASETYNLETGKPISAERARQIEISALKKMRRAEEK